MVRGKNEGNSRRDKEMEKRAILCSKTSPNVSEFQKSKINDQREYRTKNLEEKE